MEPLVVIVTGVGKSTGIGFEVCRQLAARKSIVILTARNREAASDLAETLKAEDLDVRPVGLDVTSDASVTKLMAETEREFGKLDCLVNNAAGVAPYGEQAASADLAVARQVLDATLLGTWRMCQAFLPLLRAGGNGRIVNVSSGAGSHGDTAFGLTTGNAMSTSYAVSKAALNALTVKLAMKRPVRGSGVLINAVCPSFTATFKGAEAMGANPSPMGPPGWSGRRRSARTGRPAAFIATANRWPGDG